MKIIADENIPFLKGRLEPLADIQYVDQFAFTPELVRDADALLIRTRTQCNAALLQGSNVKLVATATIGMDQIDLEWCRQNGVEVRNSPGCNAPGVAQYVWSSLLRSGFEPSKHKLGIVGCGNVGSIVADWARLLGTEILVNDPPKQESDSPGDYPYTDLHTLLRECDAVTLHTPLTKTGKYPSYHLISREELEMMRNGAILVNAARGPVVDTPALIDALKEKKLRAIIDTWEGEPNLSRELLELVEIGTFHIAGYSLEGKQRATRMVLEALQDKFGLQIDMTGLEGAYRKPSALTAQQIADSYNPFDDMKPLVADPAAFDRLRHDYHFRPEVKI